MNARKKGLAAGIAAFAVVATFVYFAQRPYSWQVDHICSDSGVVLPDEVFQKKAFEHLATEWVRRTGRSSFTNKYEELNVQYPECCKIYKGPPADYMQPPTWWEDVTNKYAKAVLVVLDIKSRTDGVVSTRRHSRLVTLDSCGNIVPN